MRLQRNAKQQKGDEYGVAIGLGNNQLLMLQKPNGKVTGFTGQVTAIPTGMPGKDAKLEEHQVQINWQDVSEWDNYIIITLPTFISELVEYTPQGLDAKLKTTLSGTSVVYHITPRCSDENEKNTLEAEILRSNVTSPAVDVSAGSNGYYTLTVEKGSTPVALVTSDYIIVKLVKKTSDVYNKISQYLTLRLW